MSADINISVIDNANRAISLFKMLPYKSGGFGVVLPRLNERQIGRLEKTFVDYTNYGTYIKVKRDETQQYSASDIVKFSYHPDGFVQFSSATNDRIVSGRYEDGTPKGLGLISWPLSDPIVTGPSMTVSFHGLEGFAEAKPSRVDSRYAFETNTAPLHPKTKLGDGDRCAYAMAIYVVPNTVKGEVIEINGRKHAYMSMMQTLPDHSAFMRRRELIRIIEMSNQAFRLGISWFSIPDRFEDGAGYVFLGPTDGKRGLMASCPAVDYSPKLRMKDLSYVANLD